MPLFWDQSHDTFDVVSREPEQMSPGIESAGLLFDMSPSGNPIFPNIPNSSQSVADNSNAHNFVERTGIDNNGD